MLGLAMIFAGCSSCSSKSALSEGGEIAIEGEAELANVIPTDKFRELAANYAGVFAGVLPCADCPGIETEVTLNPDHTYTIRRVYLERADGKAFTESGTWVHLADLRRIECKSAGGASTCFALIDPSTIELLNCEGKPIDTEHNLRLERK